MQLVVLGSTSKGNCYIIQDNDEALIIEAGVNMLPIKKALGYDLRKVAGCLITHRHSDHSKSVSQLLDCGLKVYALQDVFDAKECAGRWNAISIHPGRGFKVGNFKVLPFRAIHNVPCVGFVITHKSFGRLLFVTDTKDIEAIPPQLNHIMIECNYSTKRLLEAVKDGRTPYMQITDLPDRHLELSVCKSILADTDLSKVSEIVLLHLSNENADKAEFLNEIERATGRIVYVATPRLKIELYKI